MSCYVTDYKIDKDAERLVALEDSIMQKSQPVTAGSRILEGFVSPVEANIVAKLTDAGYTVSGRTRMNEFGLLPLGEEKNEASGAVEAVSENLADLALCNDFSGTVRREAPLNGLFYIHPTYGTVSRHGLIPVVSSMDSVGVLCGDIYQGFELLAAIAGNDGKDGAMFPEESYEYKSSGAKITVTAPENVFSKAVQADRAAVMEFIKHFDVIETELKYFEALRQVQYILVCAEASGNLSRYDGIKFGYRTENYKNLEELYLNTRTEGFGPTVKLALTMGAMVLSQEQYKPYYEKALKIRRAVKESLPFGDADIIVLPSRIEGDLYDNSAIYAIATLAGLPSVSLPYAGGCIQLVAAPKNESALLTAVKGAGI